MTFHMAARNGPLNVLLFKINYKGSAGCEALSVNVTLFKMAGTEMAINSSLVVSKGDYQEIK